MDVYHSYFSRGKPLVHYFHHFFFANIGLFIAYLAYGSITIWEAALFLFMTFSPLIDELTSAAIRYLDSEECRLIINYFFAGEVVESLYQLHKKRIKLYNLIFHNLPFYLLLCSFLYFLIIFDIPILFYAVAGVLTHLILDIINDQYELKTIKKWFWPIFDFSFQKLAVPKHHEDPASQEVH